MYGRHIRAGLPSPGLAPPSYTVAACTATAPGDVTALWLAPADWTLAACTTIASDVELPSASRLARIRPRPSRYRPRL